MPKDPPRLIDLHSDWLLQYVPDTGGIPPEAIARAVAALPQGEGYLGSVSAAVLAVRRDADDWANRPDPWRVLGDMLARVEAEFPGRLLIGLDDLARWRDDPDGLSWGVMAIDGFDGLIRSSADLDRLPGLFARGVRVFRPARTAASLLGGSTEPGDGRGLTDLGRDFLDRLLAISTSGPRPILDLSGWNAVALNQVLSWFEADGARPERLLMIGNRVVPGSPATSTENLARLRALGAVIGIAVSPPEFASSAAVRRAIDVVSGIPFRGRIGPEGIGLSTGFLGLERTLPGLSNAGEVVAWGMTSFDEATALAILRGNAEGLFARAIS